VKATRDTASGTARGTPPGTMRLARGVSHPAPHSGRHFVYIVRCADGTLYTGYARDPHEREKVHNTGRGAHYTACRRPVRLVYFEDCASRGDALSREYRLKRLTRQEKEALIEPATTRVAPGASGGRRPPSKSSRLIS